MRMYYSNVQTQYAHDCNYKAELKQDWRSDRVHGEKPRLTATLVGSRVPDTFLPSSAPVS